jgi:hypothetical protein
MEEARPVHSALGHQEMEVGVKIDPVAECLNGGDDSGHKLAPRDSLKITGQGAESAGAKLPQEPAFELEENPQHLGNRKDHLAVRNVKKERLPHPLAPLLKTLSMAGRTEAPRLAGKREQMFQETAKPVVIFKSFFPLLPQY